MRCGTYIVWAHHWVQTLLLVGTPMAKYQILMVKRYSGRAQYIYCGTEAQFTGKRRLVLTLIIAGTLVQVTSRNFYWYRGTVHWQEEAGTYPHYRRLPLRVLHNTVQWYSVTTQG